MDFQIYLFLCVFLFFTGVRLSYDKFNDLLKFSNIFNEGFITNITLKIVSAIGSLVFGVVSILNPLETVFLGDLIPALLSILGGLILAIQCFNKEYNGENKFLTWSQGFIRTNFAIIGVLMIIASIVHAIFPQILLL